MLYMLPDKPFIQSESTDRIRCAPWYQTRTSGDVHYFTGDIVCCKRENNSQWYGPWTVIWHCSKQILVKHGSVYVQVHACRITHAINNGNNNGIINIGDTAKNDPNLFLSDSKNIDQNNSESDVLSNLETVNKDKETIDNTNNENEHSN